MELGLIGMPDFMIKKANGTILPLILPEIYRALTIVCGLQHTFTTLDGRTTLPPFGVHELWYDRS